MKLSTVLTAVFLVLLGILLLTGVLDFMLRIMGVLCLAVAVGLIIAAFAGRRKRYGWSS